jgi:hypothetical protein
MNDGSPLQAGHRGDTYSSSAEVPSRPFAINMPFCATSMRPAMPTLTASSTKHAARRALAAGAARKATAIGIASSSRAEVSGRPGDAVPPHQMRNAPTVARSAVNSSAISTARRAPSPPPRHIRQSPVAAST